MVTRGKSERRETPSELSNIEAAYLAGLFDGEGFISLILIRKSTTAGGVIPYYFRPTVAMTNTSEMLVTPFSELFGGAISSKRVTTSGNQVWDWRQFDRRAESLCRSLVPHLRYKKRLAELVLSFYDDRTPGYKAGKVGLSLEEVERRIGLMRQMLELRGSGRELNEERISDYLDYYRHPQRLNERALGKPK